MILCSFFNNIFVKHEDTFYIEKRLILCEHVPEICTSTVKWKFQSSGAGDRNDVANLKELS